MRFEFRDAVTDLASEKTIIQCEDRHIQAIHYNSRSIAPVRLPAARLPPFYRRTAPSPAVCGIQHIF